MEISYNFSKKSISYILGMEFSSSEIKKCKEATFRAQNIGKTHFETVFTLPEMDLSIPKPKKVLFFCKKTFSKLGNQKFLIFQVKELSSPKIKKVRTSYIFLKNTYISIFFHVTFHHYNFSIRITRKNCYVVNNKLKRLLFFNNMFTLF